MCLATPVQIKRKKNKENKVLVTGNMKVDVSLVSDVKVGDWLLCHADLAVQKIPESQAMEVLELNKMCHHH